MKRAEETGSIDRGDYLLGKTHEADASFTCSW